MDKEERLTLTNDRLKRTFKWTDPSGTVNFVGKVPLLWGKSEISLCRYGIVSPGKVGLLGSSYEFNGLGGDKIRIVFGDNYVPYSCSIGRHNAQIADLSDGKFISTKASGVKFSVIGKEVVIRSYDFQSNFFDTYGPNLTIMAVAYLMQCRKMSVKWSP